MITCCNLLCGCAAVGTAFYSVLSGDYFLPFGFIVLGAVFDFFDGFAARLLGVSGPMGKELDSLADVITFGFAPAVLAVSLLLRVVPQEGALGYVAFTGFLIAPFSALRLAKFNIDTRQAMGFLGLPTPANALFWSSVAVTMSRYSDWVMAHTDVVLPMLLCFVALSCWILVSEVPMFALKFHDFTWKNNKIRFSFIAVSALLLGVLTWGGFAAIVVLYVLVSVVTSHCHASKG